MRLRRALARALVPSLELGQVLALTLGAAPALAGPLWEKGEASLELSGSIRELALYSRQTSLDAFEAALDATCLQAASFPDCPSFGVVGETAAGQSLTRLRFEADMRATSWLSAEVVYDWDVQAGTLDTLEASLGSSLADRSFFGAEGTILEGDHVVWDQRLYRGFVHLETRRFEALAGRMRVAWGVGKLWNPIDRFSALPPLALQPDITPGIDGVDLRYNFDGFSYLQVVFAPARDMDDMRVAARLHGVLLDTDLSVMGGVFEQAPVVGVDFARNAFGAAFAFEVVYTHPTRDVWLIEAPAPAPLGDYWQLVFNVDRTFDLGSGLYVLLEYLYNGNALGFGSGEAGPLLPFFEATDVPPPGTPGGVTGPYPTPGTPDLFGSSRVVTSAKHQIGFQLGYELTPELNGNFVGLIDADGGSAAFFPNLMYTPLDWLDVSVGVQLFAGPRLSQYGDQSPLVYGQLDLYY